MKDSSEKNITTYFWEFILEFCRNTTFHGFNFLAENGRHWPEKLFWVIILVSAAAFSGNLVHSSYSRFQKDPTIVSIDKNYIDFIVHMPAVTVCLMNKFNETKPEKLIKRKWNVGNGTKFNYYMNFLQTLSNSSYYDLKNFDGFANDSLLNSENSAKLMIDINFGFDPTEVPGIFHKTLTETGICFSYNSYITPFSEAGNGQTNQNLKTSKKFPQLSSCDYYDFPCLEAFKGFSRTLKFYVHSPFDLPDLTSKHWRAGFESVTTSGFTFFSINSDSVIKNLKIEQRKCYFSDEGIFPESPYYSLKLCRMNCRIKLAMKLCKCVPHFYMKKANQPYCDIKGLGCLANHSDYIIKLFDKNSRKKYPCVCYPSCSDTEYFLNYYHNVNYIKFYKINVENIHRHNRLSWGIYKFPKIAFQRGIVFGIEDLVASLGGTFGLFLGSSIMSVVEFIYYFTFRLTRYSIKIYKAEKSKRRKWFQSKADHTQRGNREIRNSW